MRTFIQILYLSVAVALMVAAYRKKDNRVWCMVMAMMVLQVVA